MTLDNGPPLHLSVFQGLKFKAFEIIEELPGLFSFSSHSSGKNDQNVSAVL